MRARLPVRCLVALSMACCGLGAPRLSQAAEPPTADAVADRDITAEPSSSSLADGAAVMDLAMADQGPPVDVVVTGKRSTEDPFEADRSVEVVGAKGLGESQPRTTPEALWDTPGVFVQQTNHGGGSPIIRGLVGPQVLLLFDGVRLNNSVYRTGPLQYLNLIDPLSLSRIEILRGPGSVLYGSDAMGGVVQLFGRAPRDTRQADAVEAHGRSQVRYASAGNSVGAHAEAELGLRGFGAMVGGTLQSFGDLRGGRGVGVQPYSGYRDVSMLSSLEYRFGDGPLAGARTKASYLYSRLDGAGRTDKLYDKQSLQIYDNELHLVYDRWHFEIEALRTVVDLTPSFQHFFERKDKLSMADDLVTRLGAVRDEVSVNTFGLDGALETTFVEDRLSLRYGGLFYRDWVGAERFERQGTPSWAARTDLAYPDGSGYSQYGGYVLLEGAPVASGSGHRLQLRGGYRLHGMSGDAPANDALPAVEFSHLGHVAMGALQYLYRDRATVALSFAQGFRAPNLQEAVMLGDSGGQFHVPNHELGPERSNTFELLGRARTWPLSWSWSGYVSLLDELLVRVPATYQGQSEHEGREVLQHTNADSGLLWGMEAGLGIDLGHGVSLKGQASYAWGERQTAEGDTEPLSRVPPLFGTATVRYDAELPERWRGFIESYIRWALEQDRLSPRDQRDTRIPEGGTPGWWTWNARAGLSDGMHHRVVAAVENLLDAEYRYHGSGIYAPGVNALLSYEASF